MQLGRWLSREGVAASALRVANGEVGTRAEPSRSPIRLLTSRFSQVERSLAERSQSAQRMAELVRQSTLLHDVSLAGVGGLWRAPVEGDAVVEAGDAFGHTADDHGAVAAREHPAVRSSDLISISEDSNSRMPDSGSSRGFTRRCAHSGRRLPDEAIAGIDVGGELPRQEGRHAADSTMDR
jgi:hypothetical protein